MLEKLKDFVKGVWKKMFPMSEIKRVTGENIAISSLMRQKINTWSQQLAGHAHWNNETVKSLKLESGICREFANIVLNEMTAVVTNEKLNEIFQKTIVALNENLQRGLGIGAMIIKPLGGDKVEYITQDKFVPIEFDAEGRLIHVMFISEKMENEQSYYHRFEFHKVDPVQGLTIINKCFHSVNNDTVGDECKLSRVQEWSALPENVTYPYYKPDYGYYVNPIANEIDGSFCGVSIFESGIDQIRDTDEQYAGLKWEYKSGERAIHVDEVALKLNENNQAEVARLDKRLYRGLNLEQNTGELFKEFSPEFRDQNIINGLNVYLRRVEFNVSLAYGDLSDTQDVEKTATECIVAKQRKYNMVTAIQTKLKRCLEDLVDALAFYNAMVNSGYETEITFEDSILVNAEVERQQDRSDLAIGAMELWEYIVKWRGKNEEEAKRIVASYAQSQIESESGFGE